MSAIAPMPSPTARPAETNHEDKTEAMLAENGGRDRQPGSPTGASWTLTAEAITGFLKPGMVTLRPRERFLN